MYVADMDKSELQYELQAARKRFNAAPVWSDREQYAWDIEDIEDELAQF